MILCRLTTLLSNLSPRIDSDQQLLKIVLSYAQKISQTFRKPHEFKKNLNLVS